MFTWTHGGKNVAVTGTCSHMSPSHFLRPTLSYAVVWLGTWNNWQDVIPLNRSEHDFTAIIDLPPGVHQYAPTMCQKPVTDCIGSRQNLKNRYKYIVDGKWTHAADQPVATDSGGNINNCMEIKEFRLGQSKNNALGMHTASAKLHLPSSCRVVIADSLALQQGEGRHREATHRRYQSSSNSMTCSTNHRTSAHPDLAAKRKSPMSLQFCRLTFLAREQSSTPPQAPYPALPYALPACACRASRLCHSNVPYYVNGPGTDDPTVLPLPNHVMLNHLYFRKHEDDHKRDILILGTTQRYKARLASHDPSQFVLTRAITTPLSNSNNRRSLSQRCSTRRRRH